MKEKREQEYVLPWVVMLALSGDDEALGLRRALSIAPAKKVAECAAMDGRWKQFTQLMKNSRRLRQHILSRWGRVSPQCPRNLRYLHDAVAIARSIEVEAAARQALRKALRRRINREVQQ